MNKSSWLFFCLSGLFLLRPQLSIAAVACSVAATPVNFGNYNPLSLNNNNSNGTISLNCTGGTASYQIALSTGNSNNYNQRRLLSGNNTLNYNLYTNPTYSSVWGNGANGTSIVSGNGRCRPSACTQVVYGQIKSGQANAVAGNYTDIITATVTY